MKNFLKKMLKRFIGPPNTKDPKYDSRRYISMWLLTLLVTVLFAGPPIFLQIFAWMGVALYQFTLIGETTYAAFLGFVWGGYLVSDYGTKRLGHNPDLPVEEDPEPDSTKD